MTRVLIVDDEENVADSYAMWLEGDYDVRTAYSGAEALELLDADTDVLLLDRRMPQQSGDEVLGSLVERGMGMGVVIVTAVDPEIGAVGHPYDAYLTKPVSREELLAAVESASG